MSEKATNVGGGFVETVRQGILTDKMRRSLKIVIGALITALCMLQIILWIFNLKDSYQSYVKAITDLDYINIGVMAFILIFVFAMFIHTVRSIVTLVTEEHEPNFAAVSSFFGFYLFSMFIPRIIGGKLLLIEDYEMMPLLGIIGGLLLIYAVIRLFDKDLKARLLPLIFSALAIVVSIVMFTQNVGNFASYSIVGKSVFPLSQLNLYDYITCFLADFIEPDMNMLQEALLIGSGMSIDAEILGLEVGILVPLLQFVPIVVQNILPFAALSMLGHLMYGMVGRNYVQYYNLEACRKLSVCMLIATGLSIASTIGLQYICQSNLAELRVNVNYSNIILTAILSAALVLLTSIPWNVYSKAKERSEDID